jgi:MoxR-like ATPase
MPNEVNYNEPATQRQLITLAALTGKDWSDKDLTYGQARELIQEYTDEPLPDADGADENAHNHPPAPREEPQDGRAEAEEHGAGDDVLLAALRNSVERIARNWGLDLAPGSDAVDEKIREIVGLPRKLIIEQPPEFPGGKVSVTELENAHKNFPELLELIADRQHVMLIGPTGGGKTTATMHASQHITGGDGQPLKFYAKPCTMTDTSSDWFGYNSAHGYEPSLFRIAYENGGVFTAEEIDAGNPSITTGMHMAVENGVGAFPDRMVEMHPDFRFVSTANTWGHGADRQYVGRNPLDAATTDRFWQMDWDYDEGLERGLSVQAAISIGAEYEKLAHDWVTFVQTIRARAFEAREQLVISPRASIKGARALARGRLPRERIEEMLLWRGVKDSVRARLLQTGRA